MDNESRNIGKQSRLVANDLGATATLIGSGHQHTNTLLVSTHPTSPVHGHSHACYHDHDLCRAGMRGAYDTEMLEMQVRAKRRTKARKPQLILENHTTTFRSPKVSGPPASRSRRS